MSEIDRLNSVTPQASIRNDRATSNVKQDKTPTKKRRKKTKRQDNDDDHKLDEYA